MKKTIASAAIFGMLLAAGSMSSAGAAEGDPGTSPENPIVVATVGDVPEGAVEDETSTYDTPEACDTTRSWVLTVPATDDQTHQEVRVKRDVPAVTEISHTEYRFGIDQRTYNPGQSEQSHTEYKYERTVQDYKTQYHFRKYTQTKTRTYTRAVEAVDHWWNWSPNHTEGPQDYTPGFPTDEGPDGRPRGTWQGPHVNGGPMQTTFGTFQTGEGNSPFFHREHISDAVEGGWGPWSDFGPWTAWVPETHTSWEDSDAPLGSPEFHGQGQDGNVQWYRVWQAQFDGQTRQVENGSHTETSDWLTSPPEGEGWEQIDNRQVVDSEAVPASFSPWTFKEFTPWTSLSDLPADPDLQDGEGNLLNLLRIALLDPETRTVIDREAVAGYTLFYVLGGEPSLNEADASWLRAEQVPAEGWTQFDERTVTDEQGTPEIVTYYAYTDGAECEKPEGFQDSDSTEKCVDGDLVTTETTHTGTPVQAEDGSWTIEETATSSQSIKENAAKCATPPHHNPPATPDVPTSVDAGLPGESVSSSHGSLALAGLAALMVLLMSGLTVAHQRNREQ